MKKIIVCLFFACILVSCHKTVKKYYDTGELNYIYQTKNNVADGYYKEYYKSGKLKVEINFIKGKATGTKKVYFENGNVDWESFYIDGKRNGFQKGYFENGALKYKSYYKDDKQNGSDTNYYYNGKIESTCEFKIDKKTRETGELRTYYIDGKLKNYSVKKNNKVIFQEKYNEEGKMIDYFRYIIFTPLKDTAIYLGDKFLSNIKIFGPVKDRNIIIIYKILDENKKLLYSDSKVLGKGKNEETLSLAPKKTFYIYFEIYDGLETGTVTKKAMKKVTVIKKKKDLT